MKLEGKGGALETQSIYAFRKKKKCKASFFKCLLCTAVALRRTVFVHKDKRKIKDSKYEI